MQQPAFDAKTQLKDVLVAFPPLSAPAPDALFNAAIRLFTTLGYTTSRQARLADPTSTGFVADFVAPTDTFSPERARLSEWGRVELLFQLTQAEVINQVSLYDTGQVDRTRIETYLFWAIELTGTDYSRTELARIARDLGDNFIAL